MAQDEDLKLINILVIIKVGEIWMSSGQWNILDESMCNKTLSDIDLDIKELIITHMTFS